MRSVCGFVIELAHKSQSYEVFQTLLSSRAESFVRDERASLISEQSR